MFILSVFCFNKSKIYLKNKSHPFCELNNLRLNFIFDKYSLKEMLLSNNIVISCNKLFSILLSKMNKKSTQKIQSC